jgi:hypothetical protein
MSHVLFGSLIAAAALVASICWESQNSVQPNLAEITGRSPVPVAVRATPGLDPADAAQGWVATALERPLFRENRRPEKAWGGVAKADESARLAGVTTGPFGNRAIFMPVDNAKPAIVREGAHISNFVVRSIEPGRVVVESGGSVRTLKPSFAERGASNALK